MKSISVVAIQSLWLSSCGCSGLRPRWWCSSGQQLHQKPPSNGTQWVHECFMIAIRWLGGCCCWSSVEDVRVRTQGLVGERCMQAKKPGHSVSVQYKLFSAACGSGWPVFYLRGGRRKVKRQRHQHQRSSRSIRSEYIVDWDWVDQQNTPTFYNNHYIVRPELFPTANRHGASPAPVRVAVFVVQWGWRIDDWYDGIMARFFSNGGFL